MAARLSSSTLGSSLQLLASFTLHVHAHVHFQPPDPESAQLFTIHDFGSDPFYAEQVERG